MNARTLIERYRLWQRSSVVVALLAAVMPFAPAHAAIQEIRVVASGVDPSPSRATQIALDYARKRAVYMVMVKMKIPNAIARAQALTEPQLQQIIRGSTIMQTRQGEGIVYADVSVSVVDEAILHVLDIDEPPDAVSLEHTAPGLGVMVLPVYVTKTGPLVWEKENVLRAPMSSLALKISHGTVVVPTGDYEDLRLIDQHNALTVKPEELQPMFERYGVREIIIAVVNQEKQTAPDGATVLIRRLSVGGFERNEQITLPPPTVTESPDDRLKEVATEIAAAATQIAASTSKQEQDKLASSPHVPLYFYYGTLREVGQIQDAVRSTEGVLQLSMPTITLNNIHGVLYLTADKAVVRKALAKKGLIVTDHEDGWQVSLR